MDVMRQKALEAQICFEDLKKKLDVEVKDPVIFIVDDRRKKQLEKACWQHDPFPGVLKPVLVSLRKKAVRRLFEPEKVVQTGPAAAILTLDHCLAREVGRLRTGEDGPADQLTPVCCDIATAGLQVIRLYMMAYEGNKEFITSRYQSAIRVDNALNGSFYKYRTKDGRYFSAHVYYESQKAKMMKVLGIAKDPDKFVFGSTFFDRITTQKAIAKWNGEELEEAAFDGGACACVLRDRSEWDQMEVGKAVDAMPLYRFQKVWEGTPKDFRSAEGWRIPELGNTDSAGLCGSGSASDAPGDHVKGSASEKALPLAGIKVLDLTHIIAGPACTRLLAEYGADVLMIRRGTYMNQEQAMLELDGWAGKKSISLDFNDPQQLKRAKELISEADVVVSSYQNGALDHFGLSEEDIHRMNPDVVYASMVCFSDTVWKQRPGWAPCAEDITGLSIRNGSREKPVNLNGVPLDYIPGFILAAGVMKALKMQMTEGGGYSVMGSLTRGGVWLHECTDLVETYRKIHGDAGDLTFSSRISGRTKNPLWAETFHKVEGNSVGTVYFPAPATYSKDLTNTFSRMQFYNI